MESKFIVGIDEVGRGPVAGPVYVCAFMCESDTVDAIVSGVKVPLRDSKKLTHKMKEKWFEYLQNLAKEKKIKYVISKTSAMEIDELGIANCIRACVNNCLKKLNIDLENTKVFLDGGLYAPAEFAQETIIKGDENIPIISLASIIAKVSRDREMTELALLYPEYAWEKNMGYGTKAHMDAIAVHGTTPLHRITFLRKSVDRGN